MALSVPFSTFDAKPSSSKNYNMNIVRESQSHKLSNVWTWIFPVTFLIHITEEYLGGGGYSSYLLRLRGINLSPSRFLMGQALAFSLMIFGIALAKHYRFMNHLMVIFGAVVLINAVTHCVQTVAHGEYVPGLVTAIILWLPLGIATLINFKGQMRTTSYWVSVALGVGIILGVEIFIMSN